jgi:hypothetical protein
MKNIILTSIALLFIAFSYSQTKLYVHDDADTYVANTETIAILPLNVQVKMRPKQMKDFTLEQLEEIQKNESLDIQKAMHSWFLTRKQRGAFKLKVQAVARTNALLLRENIDIHNLDIYTPTELGEILGVETVIMGTFETSKPMSVGAGAALLVLTGGAFSTQTAVTNLDFYNVSDGELVVNYYKKVRGGLGTDSQDMINTLMRKVTRRIPYTRDGKN